MRPNQKLILKLLATELMTSAEIGHELGITKYAVNANLKLLREQGHFVRICGWQMTGGRGRPIYTLSKVKMRDVPEPKTKSATYYAMRSYYKQRAKELRVIRQKRTGQKASPWDGINDIWRLNAA